MNHEFMNGVRYVEYCRDQLWLQDRFECRLWALGSLLRQVSSVANLMEARTRH